MNDCPACGGSLRYHGALHCNAGTCPWIKCGTCSSTVDADTANYWNRQHLTWGNADGYLKAELTDG